LIEDVNFAAQDLLHGMLRAKWCLKEAIMDHWTFVAEYLNGSAVWVLVLAFVAVVVGLAIKRVAEQPYFGGRKHMESLEEHYIHGEMTTEEYEDRKNHISAR
jgi:uncharacterized membrane protein